MINITSGYAKELIKESIQEAKAEMERARRRQIGKLLDYYCGKYTDQYIKKRFAAKVWQEVPIVNFNITKRFIDRMARIYTLGANRNVDKKYEKLTRFKDTKMKHIEKITRLLGTLAVKVEIKYDIYNEPYFDYEPIYYFNSHFHNDPMKPVAIRYPILTNTYDLAIDSIDKLKHAYWDNERVIIYDEDGNTLEETAHEIGLMPMAFMHREFPVAEFYSSGADDIVSCNESINILLTEANLGMRFQMFGQQVITGFYANEKQTRMGSDELFVLPEGSKFENVARSGNVEDAIKLIKTQMDICAQNNHLYVSFAESSSDRPTSGIALKIKDLERFEDYSDDVELFREHEHNLYDIEKAVAKASGISLSNNFAIDFEEPNYPMTPTDQIALEQWELENGLTNPAELLVKRNKELTIDEAKKIIEENRNLNGNQQERTIFDRIRNQVTATE